MKRALPFLILITSLISLTPNTANAQFALGDIAFTGYNSDGTEDAFSFVLLRNVSIGEQISFTENGWLAAGGFRVGENTVTLTFSGNYNCGSQIFISAVPFGARDESLASAGVVTGSGLALSASGDQILAYDPANMPSPGDETGFVAAIHMNGVWDADATSTNTSAKPTVFTDGVNSISITPEVDNAQYNCSVTSGNAATVLAPAIWNLANWNTDNTTAYTAPAPCTLSCIALPCNDPTVPVVTIINPTVCDGDSVMLNISGTLNDATAWTVYTGSCGGTLVGSTAGTTMMVEVSGPTVNYFVRGEGACVVPGACGQASAFGIPRDDATFAYTGSTFCTTDPLQTPTTTLPGGNFTASPAGLSITAALGLIDPSLSTPNTYTVYYTTNGTCPSTDSTSITITTNADATITPAGPFCTNDAPVNLTAVDGGGVWAGPGITDINNGTFDPATAGPGGHTISYTISGTCGDVGITVITVNPTPVVTLAPFNPDTVCQLSGIVTLPVGTPAGGTYTGNGVSGTTFDPSAVSPGDHTITYSVTTGGCTDSTSTSINVQVCVGIATPTNDQEFTIYPNPSKGEFTVNVVDFDDNTTLSVVDILGKRLVSRTVTSTITSVNLSRFNKGVYFVKIQSNKGNVIKKVVIE